MELHQNVTDAIPPFDQSDDLHRAEHYLRGVLIGQADWSTIGTLMAASFYAHYSFSMMALDEAAVDASTAPPILAAAWNVARSAGL